MTSENRIWSAVRSALLAAFMFMGLANAAQAADALRTCAAKPPLDRALYLRGAMNSWAAQDKFKFNWACDRYELVANISGEHRFKVADENWSRDADWGAEPPEGSVVLGFDGSPKRMLAVGAPMSAKFSGNARFVVRMVNNVPELSATSCPAQPLAGDPKLFLRGTPNNWTTLDEFAFRFSCDAYYLNVLLTGAHSFKVADAAWTAANTFGAPQQAGAARMQLNAVNTAALGGQDASFNFEGAHTIRLDVSSTPPTLRVGAKTFADPTAKAVTDPVALSVKFDSRNPAQRSPYGAVPAGTQVSFSVDAAKGVKAAHLIIESRELQGNQEVLNYTRLQRIALQRTLTPSGERFATQHRFDQMGVYGYWFEVLTDSGTFAYQNNSDAVFWTREKGSGGLGDIAELASNKEADAKAVRRFRISVFDPAFQVPAWAQDAVYYYIFPDRFRNGNKANDPQPGRARYQNNTVELHKNWLNLPYKPGSGDGSDALFNNDFFGGDIAGIVQKLDHIKSLGANTLYLTPVFRAASNHKYDAGDFLSIDPGFGTNKDFDRLTREAKKRGIRVMVDTSFNHVGADSPYFDRFGNFDGRGAFYKGRINAASPYAKWFSFDAAQPDADKQFKGWVGINDLPELNKDDPGFRAFAYGNPDSVTRKWLKQGAAGWRMDVAPWVPDSFWREWRKVVKATDPQAMTVSETWFDASKHVLGDMFDSTMNYIFRNTVLEFANGGNAAELYKNLEHLREAYPPQALHGMMNLLSGHDQARALHHFGMLDATTPADKVALAKQRLKLATAFQFIYPGSPAIYYGDEVGVTGGDDPYNRATYPWKDLGGKPDEALQAEFKKLAQLRAKHRVLRQGELLAPLFADATTLVLARRLKDAKGSEAKDALIVLTNGKTEREVEVKLPWNQQTRKIKVGAMSWAVELVR